MEVDASEESFRAAYQHGLDEKARGRTYALFDLETLAPVKKYVYLWENCLGEFVERLYYPNDAPYNPDIPAGRMIRGLRVRVRIADLVEAMRRFEMRVGRERRAPIPANTVERPKAMTLGR